MRIYTADQLYPEPDTKEKKIKVIAALEEPELAKLYFEVQKSWRTIAPVRRPASPLTIKFEDARQDKNISQLELADIYLRSLWFLSDEELGDRRDKAIGIYKESLALQETEKSVRESMRNEFRKQVEEPKVIATEFHYDKFLSKPKNQALAVQNYCASIGLSANHESEINITDLWDKLAARGFKDNVGKNLFTVRAYDTKRDFFRNYTEITFPQGRRSI